MNGILLVNKEKEYTSHDVVAIVKKITREKVGHTGTLDPNATGVLPLLIGKATLISKYLINHDKIYIATLKLGIKTDTADGEGTILEKQDISKLNIDEEKITHILKDIVGKQQQFPPMYSAIKINGKKLYEYARNGQTIDVKPRNIEIYNTKLINYNKKEDEIEFEISCSKGTYIRTVCEDVAKRLNTIGYMKELKRIQVGDFNIKKSYLLKEIKQSSQNIENLLITTEEMFKNKDSIELTDKELQLFLNGVKLKKEKKEDFYKIYNNKQFIGTGIVEKDRLKRDVIV